MAKSKTKSTSRRGAARAASARRGVAKGTLEVGNPRRGGNASGPMGRTGGSRGARKAAAQLPGEKAVKATSRTVPVGPKRRATAGAETLPTVALDRRRQVVGTDELPPQTRR